MFRTMRRKKQEVSKEVCVSILKKEKRGVLAVMGDGGYPYAIPINFYYDEDDERLYLHCAKEGHKIDAIRSNNRVCFTVWGNEYKKEGDWAPYVTSVIAFGRAELVDDEALTREKVGKLGCRYYPDPAEVEEGLRQSIGRVQLIAITIDQMTGKVVHEK